MKDQDDNKPEMPETVEAAAAEGEEDEGLLAEAAGEAEVDQDAAFDEFKDYDSLDEESIGDAQLEALAGETDEDRAAQVTPKERRLSNMRLEARVEAVIFASQKPLKTQEILDIIQDATLTIDDVQVTLDHLVDFYEFRSGGFRLHYLKRLGYQFQTADAAGPIMERMFASRPRPISRAALETLAIIAYRQPVTRAEVEFIRGVDAGSIFKTLLERDLIKCTGRKEIVGRPMLFGTTDDFLKVFNLSSVKDLPPLESFQPSRDMVQGALEKIDGADDLIDVEEYIADNTRGEYEGDEDLLLEGGDSEGGDEERRLEGATAEPPAGVPEEGYGEDPDTEVAVPIGDGVPPGSGDLDH